MEVEGRVVAKHWTDQFSYVTGVVRTKERAYVSLIGDDVAKKRLLQSILMEWDAGTWRGGDVSTRDWSAVGATVALKPLEQAVFLGAGGQVCCAGSGDLHDERVGSSESTPADRGPMRGIRTIGGSVYAVGMDRQAYRRDQSGKWKCIDKTARPRNRTETVGFEAIDGFDEKEIYAVGWDGEIWHYNGKTWSQKDSPTNVVLVDVCCAGDGNVYAAGRIGALVCGREDTWELVEHDDIKDGIWSLAWYRDQLYLSTMEAIYTLKDGHLHRVDMGEDRPDTCYHLSVADGVMWSIGAKDILEYDGKSWKRID